jgi:hypothetical protein
MRKNVGNWRPEKELPEKSKSCSHPWKENCVTGFNTCYYCGMLTTERSRLHCPKCEQSKKPGQCTCIICLSLRVYVSISIPFVIMLS